MIPYEESQVIAFVLEIQPLLPGDLGRLAVNTARMQADATGFKGQPAMGYAASRAKHLAELKAELGVNPNPPGGTVPPPGVIVRGPLPAWDPDTTDPDTGASLPVRKVLQAQPPDGPSVHFMRANLWGMTLPGLPAIPGGASGQAQNRMLTYLADRYPVEWLDKGVRQYVSNGYTHWWLSWPDAFNHGNNQTLTQYIDTCKRIQDGGVPYLCHFLRSKDYDPHNANAQDIEPVLERLLKNNVIAHACPAWEASLFYDPETFMQVVEHDAAILVPAGVPIGIHLQAGYADFGPDGHNDHGPIFWRRMIAAGVKRLHYQYRPEWTGGMMQARGNDVSVRLIKGGLWNLPETVAWDAFELVGVPLFNNGVDGDGRLATEDTADLKSYEMMCTIGPLPPAGYGNGCRRPDGTVL